MSAAATHPAPAARRVRVPDAALPWLGVLGVLVLIELVVRIGLISSRYFPPMTDTGAALFGLLGDSAFWTAIAHTLEGWAIGLAHRDRDRGAGRAGARVQRGRLPRGAAGDRVPAPGPVGGAGPAGDPDLRHRAARARSSWSRSPASWPLLIQTIYGARDLDPLQLETARSFRIRRRDRVLRVTLMGAVPYIATGLRIASATALILAITAELIIGSAGLGRSINIARQGGAVDEMYALIVTTGLLGWGLNTLFAAWERRALHWHPSQRRVAQ